MRKYITYHLKEEKLLPSRKNRNFSQDNTCSTNVFFPSRKKKYSHHNTDIIILQTCPIMHGGKKHWNGFQHHIHSWSILIKHKEQLIRFVDQCYLVSYSRGPRVQTVSFYTLNKRNDKNVQIIIPDQIKINIRFLAALPPTEVN